MHSKYISYINTVYLRCIYTIYTYYIFICMCNLIKKLLVERPLLCTFSTNLAIEVPPLLLTREKIGLKSSPFVCNTCGWIQPELTPDPNCMPWHLPLGSKKYFTYFTWEIREIENKWIECLYVGMPNHKPVNNIWVGCNEISNHQTKFDPQKKKRMGPIWTPHLHPCKNQRSLDNPGPQISNQTMVPQ